MADDHAGIARGEWLGPPGARDRAMVREGLLDGFVTPEQAKTVYTAG
jgi:N-methylhydantoinase B